MTEPNVNPDVESMDLGTAPAPNAGQPANGIVDPKDIPCPPSGNEDEDENDAERRLLEKREGKKKEVVDAQDARTVPVAEEKANAATKHKHKKRRSKRRPAPEVRYGTLRATSWANRWALTVFDFGRPILTIRSSQGFVWNQDLFVPPYIKDRCKLSLCAPFPATDATPLIRYRFVTTQLYSRSRWYFVSQQ